MTTSTYQLTAEHLVQKHGMKLAQEISKNLSRHSRNVQFWRYVHECVLRMAQELAQ